MYGRKSMAVDLANLCLSILTTSGRKKLEKRLAFYLPETYADLIKLSNFVISYYEEYVMLGIDLGFIPPSPKKKDQHPQVPSNTLEEEFDLSEENEFDDAESSMIDLSNEAVEFL